MKIFQDLPSLLIGMIGTSLNFNKDLEFENKSHLKLSDNLIEHLIILKGWMVGEIIIPNKYFPSFDQKTSLAQWMINTACLYAELLGQAQTGFMPPADLQNVEIWCGSYFDVYSEREKCLGDSYWNGIFSLLERWWRLTQTTLELIEWKADAEQISLFTTWRGPFRSIESILIENGRNNFWTVTFHPPSPLHLPVVSTALLLNVELEAQQGGNNFTPVKIEDDRLTLMLRIPRVGIASHPPVPWVDETVIDQVTSYILNEIISGYLETDQYVEVILSEEFKRLETYVSSDDTIKEWFEHLQTTIPYVLAIARKELKTFTGDNKIQTP